MVATGANAYSVFSRRRETCGTSGGIRRVVITGITAAQIRIAVSVNIAGAPASPAVSRIWPSANADRLIAMYTENTRLRRRASGSALSQLSITVYRPTSAAPVTRRSRPQPQAFNQIGCSNTAIAASAA